MRQQYAVLNFFKETRRGSALLWSASLLMLMGMVICFGLQFIDLRLIAGVNVWEKPAKFFLSLFVQAVTIAWALSLLERPARGVKTAAWIFLGALTVEMAYMIFRASRGEASHFNVATPFAAIMYAVMGVGALCLTLTSAFVGWRVWQQRSGSLMREAVGIGLMLGAALGTIAGGYLSSLGSHWIGGIQNDAVGLGFFHWSSTGGDLRVAHFVGLHVAQALPLAALSGNRWVVYGAAAAGLAMTVAVFAIAVMGVPLLQA